MIYQEDLSIFDILLGPLYFFMIWIIGTFIKKNNIINNPEYRYFLYGLMAKVVGAVCVGLVYYFYYTDGGDTTNYFESARSYVNLFFKDQESFFHGWLGDATGVDNYFFDEETGYSVYRHRDKNSFFVVRLLIPIQFLSFNSYFACAMLVACVSYSGVWKLYKTFLSEFPMLQKELAIAVLFVPSCVFWGSGILKDSFTLSAVGWFTYAFYFFFIKKRRKISFAIALLLSAFVIISIKPYILFALLPGAILWLSNQQIKRIHNDVLRFLTAPFLLVIGGGLAYLALDKLGDSLGIYKIDTVLDHAVVVQKDMKAEYYGGKSYDIGTFDASIGSVLEKAPIAIFSGIFRPGLWDVKNVVMMVSSLENTYLLLLTGFLLIKLKVFRFFGLIRSHPMLLFSMLFSLFFAFSVGLAVANFGSLVRLRIPELPFFVAGIFILRYLYEQKSGKKVKF